MSDVTDQISPEPPAAGDESSSLIGSLERLRAVFAWKCGGLDAVGMRATTADSALTLGGLVKHLALVEDDTFSRALLGQKLGQPWNAVDWDADPNWEWRTGAEDGPDQVTQLWRDAVSRSRATLEQALADGGLDQLTKGLTNARGEAYSLRRLLLDLIEEYARHIGHADLIRESVDGLVGESPPH
jgi:Protein of unknown function (DUF664)